MILQEIETINFLLIKIQRRNIGKAVLLKKSMVNKNKHSTFPNPPFEIIDPLILGILPLEFQVPTPQSCHLHMRLNRSQDDSGQESRVNEAASQD